VRVFVLTGAGVSAESGLGTFRDRNGLWTQFDLEEVATPQGYERDPGKVLDFYNLRRRNLVKARPNEAHAALARLERGLASGGDELFLCTQNVDDLHEQAGSERVVHMHGELLKARCAACGEARPWREDIGLETGCPGCGAVGRMRPHVVWFGEMPLDMDLIHDELRRCDLFVAVGTSGSVYPAADFVREARRAGAKTCELNLEPSDTARHFDEVVCGPASQVVPAWVDSFSGSADRWTRV
jgi:NAD-dependent deacetylase